MINGMTLFIKRGFLGYSSENYHSKLILQWENTFAVSFCGEPVEVLQLYIIWEKSAKGQHSSSGKQANPINVISTPIPTVSNIM